MNLLTEMASVIKTVGVISTGVIGSSFIALFLANGLRVLVCSPSVGAEERLSKYLENVWPTLKDSLSPGASLSNYKFVGETLDGYYDQVDFIQEACLHGIATVNHTDIILECSREA